MEFIGTGTKLSNVDIQDLAKDLDIESAIVHAVCDVESAGSGFLKDHRPKILFEAHVFYRLTGGRFGQSNISNRVWDKSLYGAGLGHQYDRLHQAIIRDREAGLKSASWGLFQIMGMNHKIVGNDSVEEFVNVNLMGEREQLMLFGEFIKHENLVRYLRDKDFESFTRRYNGPGQVDHYTGKLIEAYEKWKDKVEDEEVESPVNESNNEVAFKLLRFGVKGEEVKILQEKLGIEIDGVFGAETLRKVKEFQTENELKVDGIVGKLTWNKLSERNQDD